MDYQVEDIVRQVRVVLDQNMASDTLVALGDVDTLSLEEIILKELPTAIRSVVLAAPIHMLGAGIPFGESIQWDTQQGIGSGYILLPDNFLRLVSFQMSDWSRAVSDAITPAHHQYALQSSRYPGVRGNPQKPVVAIVNRPIGMVLEFYSCKGGSDVYIKIANYIPLPSIQLGKVRMPHLLKDAIVHYTAYLVAMSIQQTEQAEKMLAISKSLISYE